MDLKTGYNLEKSKSSKSNTQKTPTATHSLTQNSDPEIVTVEVDNLYFQIADLEAKILEEAQQQKMDRNERLKRLEELTKIHKLNSPKRNPTIQIKMKVNNLPNSIKSSHSRNKSDTAIEKNSKGRSTEKTSVQEDTDKVRYNSAPPNQQQLQKYDEKILNQAINLLVPSEDDKKILKKELSGEETIKHQKQASYGLRKDQSFDGRNWQKFNPAKPSPLTTENNFIRQAPVPNISSSLNFTDPNSTHLEFLKAVVKTYVEQEDFRADAQMLELKTKERSLKETYKKKIKQIEEEKRILKMQSGLEGGLATPLSFHSSPVNKRLRALVLKTEHKMDEIQRQKDAYLAVKLERQNFLRKITRMGQTTSSFTGLYHLLASSETGNISSDQQNIINPAVHTKIHKIMQNSTTSGGLQDNMILVDTQFKEHDTTSIESDKYSPFLKSGRVKTGVDRTGSSPFRLIDTSDSEYTISDLRVESRMSCP